MCNKQTIWTVACLVGFATTLVINYLSTNGVIGKSQGELSDKYGLPITPPGWAFSIWGIIYLWQGAWLIYLLYHSIKFSSELKSKSLLTFGLSFYITWLLSCLFNMAWIVSFSLEELALSAVVLISISLSLYSNAFISHKYIGRITFDDAFPGELYPSYLVNSKTVRVLYRVLLLNGVAFYATWCSIAQCLNIAIFLTYDVEMDVYAASMVALGVLTTLILAYWSLDFYFLRRWLAYTYSPYAVLLWALGAVSTNSSDGELGLKGPTRTWVLALVALAAVGTVAKVISGVCYAVRPTVSQNGVEEQPLQADLETEYKPPDYDTNVEL